MFTKLFTPPEAPARAAHASRVSFLMNTWFRVDVWNDCEQTARLDVDAAFDAVREAETLLSRFMPESAVSRVNRDAWGSDVPIPAELLALLKRALALSRNTNGAFDVTLAALVDLWREAEHAQRFPDAGILRDTAMGSGWQALKLNEELSTVRFLKPHVRLDLGAIGKGYALDRASEVLKRRRVHGALLDAGGNLLSLGFPKRRVGIRHPLDERRIVHRLRLDGEAVATSANDQRSLRVCGRDCGHLLEPRTGRPAQSETLSVSVVAKNAATADALSTALFVQGPERGLEAARGCGASRVVIVRSGRLGGVRVEDVPLAALRNA